MEQTIKPYKKFKKMYIVDKTGAFKGRHNSFQQKVNSILYLAHKWKLIFYLALYLSQLSSNELYSSFSSPYGYLAFTKSSLNVADRMKENSF